MIDEGCTCSDEKPEAPQSAPAMRAPHGGAELRETLLQRDRITAISARDIDILVTDCTQRSVLDPFEKIGIRVIAASTRKADAGNNSNPHALAGRSSTARATSTATR